MQASRSTLEVERMEWGTKTVSTCCWVPGSACVFLCELWFALI